MLTKSHVMRLLYRCIQHENAATTPARRKYWDRQYTQLRALAVKVGWID